MFFVLHELQGVLHRMRSITCVRPALFPDAQRAISFTAGEWYNTSMKADDLYRNQIRPMLEKSKGRLRMHMPGHKAMIPDMPIWTDTTEIPLTDDLFAPHAGILRAEEAAAITYGAGHSLMLTGGSTAGMLAMMLYAAHPGDIVILPRNCHHSAISAVVLGDLHPVFIDARMGDDGYAYILPQDVLDKINEYPGAAFVLLTRPDYYGMCMDLSGILFSAHSRGMRVLIDEAHGAHFPMLAGVKNAAHWDADLWVTSAHKTLPALTGAAYLHLRKSEDPERMRQILRMVHSSSPSFQILCSLEDARAYLVRQGAEKLRALTELCERTRLSFERAGYRCPQENWAKAQECAYDPTRLVIDVSHKRLSGFEALEQLASLGVDMEMADHRRLVAITTIMDRMQDMRSLAQCVMQLQRGDTPLYEEIEQPAYGDFALDPRAAVFSPSELIAPLDAVGRISAVSVGAYPPGIPQIIPGERFTEGVVRQIFESQNSSHTFGLAKGLLRVVIER